jgi:hypothetical protein
MLNQLQCAGAASLQVCQATPSPAPSPAPSSAPSIDITAVTLLKLMLREESGASAESGGGRNGTLTSFSPEDTVGIPIYVTCDSALALSPYLQEQLRTITEAIFNGRNGDFYRAYRGMAPGDAGEIVLSKEDLRPLAYRALMHERNGGKRPFAPGFASSLLLLQKYWDCQFFQQFKDSCGCLSAQSLKTAQVRF